MRRKSQRRKNTRPKLRLGLPDLDQSKSAVLGSLRSPESQRGYRHAIDEFIEWYCSEPRLSSAIAPPSMISNGIGGLVVSVPVSAISVARPSVAFTGIVTVTEKRYLESASTAVSSMDFSPCLSRILIFLARGERPRPKMPPKIPKEGPVSLQPAAKSKKLAMGRVISGGSVCSFLQSSSDRMPRIAGTGQNFLGVAVAWV